MNHLKPKPIISKTTRRLFQYMFFLLVPVLIALGAITKAKPTLWSAVIIATVSVIVLAADWIVRKRNAFGSSKVGNTNLRPLE